MPNETSPQLRAALEEAARLRAQNAGLQRERDQATAQARTEAGSRIATEEAAIDSALVQAEEERRTLPARLAELQADGKFTEAAELTAKMSDTSARIAGYRQQKETLASRRTAAEQQPATPPAPQDPLDGLNERERAWVAEHPAYLSDRDFQGRAAAAANYATRVLNLDRNSDAYFEHVNRAVTGERLTAVAPAGPAEPAEPNVAMPNSPAPREPAAVPLNNTPDEPAMRVETEMIDQMYPQQRAIGKGGGGIRQVAAPPSRRIAELAARHARGGAIEPTMVELETARALIRDIAPEIAARGDDEEIVRTYYAWYHSPSAERKRARWYDESAA